MFIVFLVRLGCGWLLGMIDVIGSLSLCMCVMRLCRSYFDMLCGNVEMMILLKSLVVIVFLMVVNGFGLFVSVLIGVLVVLVSNFCVVLSV